MVPLRKLGGFVAATATRSILQVNCLLRIERRLRAGRACDGEAVLSDAAGRGPWRSGKAWRRSAAVGPTPTCLGVKTI